MLIFQIDSAAFHGEFSIWREQNQVIITPAWARIVHIVYIYVSHVKPFVTVL